MKKNNQLKKRIAAFATALTLLTSTAYLPRWQTVSAAGTTTSVTQTEQKVKITSQPSNVTAEPGQKTTFTVRASGSGLKYQWYFKKDSIGAAWTEWAGHTTAVTSASANVTWDGMLVRCEVTDSDGNSVVSEAAKVKIKAPLQIVRQPSDTMAVLGETTVFSVKAVGSGLKYQWYFKKKGLAFWTLWKGHITAVTSAVANTTWEGMQLQCIITDSTGSTVTSRNLTVRVDSPITITAQPKDVTLKLGSSVTFKTEATGLDVRYRWYYKKAGQTEWNKWDDRTTPETTAKVNKTWEGMLIKCVVTGNVNRTQETVPARITVDAPLSITTQPKNVTVKIQKKAEFSIEASGIGLKYQWYIKKDGESLWTKFGKNTSATVSGISEASWHKMNVKCVVSDNVGKKVTSKSITVTIDTSGYPDYLVSLLGRNKEAASFVLNYPIRKDSYKGVTFNLTEYKNSKTVPLFMQWDERWGYDKYGTGCIGTSGCGPTALSMVSMYLLNDTTLTPRKLAQFAIKEKYCVPGAGSSWSLMDKGGVKLGMKVTRVSNSEDAIKKQLKKGHPIVAIMGKGYFTTGGHYIVFTNYVDNKIKVNDSNSYINSEKLWKYSDIKGQIRNLWAFSVPAKTTSKAAAAPALEVLH